MRPGQSAPCGAGGALRAPAPPAGPEGLLGFKPENPQVPRGQVQRELLFGKLEWRASAQLILSIGRKYVMA